MLKQTRISNFFCYDVIGWKFSSLLRNLQAPKFFVCKIKKKRKKGFTNVNFYWQQIEYDRFPNIKSKIMRKHMVELILRISF